MVIVLHTIDLEPITVVNVPFEFYKALIDEPGKYSTLAMNETAKTTKISAIKINAHNGLIDGYIFVVEDDELALSFAPSCLPGQQAVVNAVRERMK